MNNFFIILLMIFCHIVDDYYLQGILASLKQRLWWKQRASEPKYKYDYIWALLMHSFSWAFMIMLPIAFVMNFEIDILFGIIFFINVIVHMIVDDLKANKLKINLWIDQLLHIAQIFITAAILLGVY